MSQGDGGSEGSSSALGTPPVVYVVTGAPGAGKSAAAAALLRRHGEHLVFDMDWLVDAGSRLAGRSIRTEPATWRPYRALWFAVLHGIIRNHKTPLLFAPINHHDVDELGEWPFVLDWLLLDCTDEVRRARLQDRRWADADIDEALEDARVLHAEIASRLDTSCLPPEQVADAIVAWVGRTPRHNVTADAW